MVFWAGSIGAVVVSVAGVRQKRRTPQARPLVAAGTAVAVVVLITVVAALLT